VAAVPGTGCEPVGIDAAGLALALFNGLLFQTLVDPASPSKATGSGPPRTAYTRWPLPVRSA
jgi:hypothetical protein